MKRKLAQRALGASRQSNRQTLQASTSLPRASLRLGLTKSGALELSARDRSVHLLLIGASRTGKTTAMESMIQQDIKAARGICLIDPMGALYQRLLDYCCYRRATGCHVPELILFNPSQGEWVLPYNPFIFRGGDVSVQVDRRVQATLRAWGQHSSDQTPRLEKWLKCLYTVLIECNLTILEAGHLLDQRAGDVRAFLLRGVSDTFVRAKLEQLAAYKPAEFLDQVESVDNRLMRFLSSKTIRRTMGIGTNALDFRAIMDQGKIVLVNLQPSRDWLSTEQQRLFGTLLLTEFFETALTRPSGAKPFYLYVDEAARFVTPELGEAFEQCRQKGLHLTLAFQHLAQFKIEDQRVYKAIKNNARNKLVFAVPDRQDAAELADDLFIGLSEPQLKLMHRRLNHLILDTRDTSRTRSIGQSSSSAMSDTRSETRGTTRGESEGRSLSSSRTRTRGLSQGRSFGRGQTFKTTMTVGHTGSQSESHSSGYSETNSSQDSHDASSSETTHEYERTGQLVDGARRDLTKGESHHSGASYSRTETGQDSYASSESYSRTRSRASGGSSSLTWSRVRQQSESSGKGESRSLGSNHATSESQSQARGFVKQRGTNSGSSVTDQPGTRHVPFFEEDPEHWSLEEQRWRAAELIMRQRLGEWFAGTLNGYGPGSTPLPETFHLSPAKMLALKSQFYQQSCISPADADAIVGERHERLLADSQTTPDAPVPVKPIWDIKPVVASAIEPRQLSPVNHETLQRKRGPKPDLENHAKVTRILSGYRETWTTDDNLREICAGLDSEGVPVPKTWLWRRDRISRSWSRAFENYQSLVVKAIKDRLKMANAHAR